MTTKQPRVHRRFSLVYTLQTPMRIGHRKIGNLQTTRFYVPGLAMWASTVNRLAALLPLSGGRDSYRYWGKFLREHCRFSCLFFLDPDTGAQLLPGREEDRLRLERLFVGSTVQTAIDHAAFVREQGMLHEQEWIMPAADQERPVTLSGWIDLAVDGTAEDGGPGFAENRDGIVLTGANGGRVGMKEVMAGVTAGADLNKGCGRLVLKEEAWQEKDEPGPEEHARGVAGQLLWTEGLKARGMLETVAGRCSLPLEEPSGTGTKEYRPGGYLYHYLAYAPGATCREIGLVPDWLGRYRITKKKGQADPEKG